MSKLDLVFSEFRTGRAPICVATDVASRGLGRKEDLFNYLRIKDAVKQVVLDNKHSFL